MNKYASNQVNTSDDEIDLGLLLLKTTKAIKRNLKVLLLFLIVGLLCGLAYFFTVQPKYESTMVISSKVLTKQNITNLVESLQELIDDGNYNLLASKLKIELAEAAKVSEIMVEELDEDATNPEEPVFLEITVLVTDTGVLPQLENGIVNFLEDNQYVSQRVAINRQKYKALIEKTQREIDQIDSLKYEIDEGLIVQSQAPNVLMMEPVNIYTASMALFEKKQNYIEQLELVSGIHVVKGFIAFQHPISPKLMLSVVTGLVIGLVLAIIVIFFAETGIYLRRLNKEHYQ